MRQELQASKTTPGDMNHLCPQDCSPDADRTVIMQVKLRASINKSMLNGGEQHLQLPKKGLPAQQIISSLEKRVGFLGQAL